MENRKCVLCYRDYIVITSDVFRNCEKTKNNTTAPNEYGYGSTEEESKILTSQISVIRLLRNILEIPQDLCTGFLQDYGNPSSWIYCCDACKPAVAKTEVLLQQIASLEKQVAVLRTGLKDAIELSIERQRSATGIQRGPTEIIRSYIMQQRTCAHCGPLGQCSINVVAEERDFAIETAEDELDPLNDDADPASVEEDSSVQLSPDVEDNYSTSINTDIRPVTEMSKKNTAQSCKSAKQIKQNRRPNILQNVVHTCTSCKKVFKWKSQWVEHLRVHTGEKPYSCPVCQRSFGHFGNMQSHIKGLHKEIFKPYSCTLCWSSFETSHLLKRHNAKKHFGETLFSCNTCDKKYVEHGNLLMHQQSHRGTGSM